MHRGRRLCYYHAVDLDLDGSSGCEDVDSFEWILGMYEYGCIFFQPLILLIQSAHSQQTSGSQERLTHGIKVDLPKAGQCTCRAFKIIFKLQDTILHHMRIALFAISTANMNLLQASNLSTDVVLDGVMRGMSDLMALCLEECLIGKIVLRIVLVFPDEYCAAGT